MKERMSEALYPKFSDTWFLDLYFRYGSVEEAIARYPDHLPISPANFHRLVARSGLVKSAGRHVSFPETLHFFKEKALAPGLPLERLYKNMPPSFQTSMVTLHRIYEHIEREAVRRWGVALLLFQDEDPSSYLVGEELGGSSRYKTTGQISIPMGFRKKEEDPRQSILRIFQQEVSTPLALEGKLTENSELFDQIVSDKVTPFMYLDIVDVRVSVYALEIPHMRFGSYKLANHRFERANSLTVSDESLRPGVSEIVNQYQNTELTHEPSVCLAEINQEILAYASSQAH